MITRVEIDGFKTFKDFQLDVDPFLAVLGPNATGKSNFFDAIQFLRRITDESLSAAVQDARGEVLDLFRRRGDGSSVSVMRFAVEVLLEPRVRDSWGTEVGLTQGRVRYDIEITRRADSDGNVRLFVAKEEAIPLRRGHRDLAVRWKASKAFMRQYVADGKRSSAFLETVNDEKDRRIFQIRQDGVQGRARPAEAAEATVLSSVRTADFKHLYALREEISSWRLLQLEPQALRRPGDRFGEDRLLPDGANLARVLARIRSETASDERPQGLLAEISADLSSLIPSVRRVSVSEDEQTRRWQVFVESGDKEQYRAEVASDGTLRVLALLTALYDPKYRGLICFEEPENGVHPYRLRRLVRYLASLVTNPTRSESDGAPLAQVIVNSHSPVVLAALKADACVFLEPATLIEEVGERRVRSTVTRWRRVIDDTPFPMFDEDGGLPLPKREIDRYKAAALLEDQE